MPLTPRREGEPATKVCNKCHEELPIDLFRLNGKNKKSGLKFYRYYHCKDCQNNAMNFPKKKWKAKHDIKKAIGNIDQRVALQAIMEDPELMKLVISRMGAQRYERIKLALVNVTLIECLERRIKYNNYRGRSLQESLKVWKEAVTELGFTIPTRLIDYKKLGLKEDRLWQ